MSVATVKAWARLAPRLYALQAKRILSGLVCGALHGFAGSLSQFVFRLYWRYASDGLELGCFPKITLKRGKIIA